MWVDTFVQVLQGKVGGAFTSVGGKLRGYGGHEAILQSFHATFLQHGMASPHFLNQQMLYITVQRLFGTIRRRG